MKTLSVAHTLLKDRFNNDKGEPNKYSKTIWFPERNKMEREVKTLIEMENNNWCKKYRRWNEPVLTPEEIEEKKGLLQVFREVFDFDTTYELELEYYTLPNTVYHSHKCKDAEELKKYLTYEIDFPQPENKDINWDNMDMNSEIEDEGKRSLSITISNFRLKGEFETEKGEQL
tara:strand:- start:33 stop:551 length:519 start_codon:yes stop_codon:yes gene_type:complete